MDVITNSSTELFVCDTDKSLKVIEEILRDLIETHNDEVREGLLDEYEKEITFNETFCKPYVFTKEELERRRKSEWFEDSYGYEHEGNIGKIFISGASSNTIPYYLWDKINEIFGAYNVHLG